MDGNQITQQRPGRCMVYFLHKIVYFPSDWGADTFMAGRKDVDKQGKAFVSVRSDVVFHI